MSGPMLAVGALVVLCCSSTSAALAMTMSGDETPTSTGPAAPAPPTQYKYEFLINVKAAHGELGSHITDIRADGTRVTSSQIQVHVTPDHTKCNSKAGGYECVEGDYGLNDPEPANPGFTDLSWTAWKSATETVGTKMFTITTTSKVKEFAIDYFRPVYQPGWLIKENGKEVLKETVNGGDANTPNPKTVKYTIP